MEKELETTLQYTFQNAALIDEALTHPSISRQCNETQSVFNFERLEFLGDSVLGLVMAELLLSKYPYENEGHLAKRQAGLVRGEAVASIAMKLGIGRFIKMTPGEESMGGRTNASNIENALEAIIGAIYLDGGLAKAQEFISKHWSCMLDSMKTPPKDSKTALQEWAQANKLPIPEYKVIETSGPSHNPSFIVEVSTKNFQPMQASGNTKKKAEKEAASKLMALIKQTEDAQ